MTEEGNYVYLEMLGNSRNSIYICKTCGDVTADPDKHAQSRHAVKKEGPSFRLGEIVLVKEAGGLCAGSIAKHDEANNIYRVALGLAHRRQAWFHAKDIQPYVPPTTRSMVERPNSYSVKDQSRKKTTEHVITVTENTDGSQDGFRVQCSCNGLDITVLQDELSQIIPIHFRVQKRS